MNRIQQRARDLRFGSTFQSSVAPGLFDPMTLYHAPANAEAFAAVQKQVTSFNMGGSVKGRPGVSLARYLFEGTRKCPEK